MPIPRFWSGYITGADIQDGSLGAAEVTAAVSGKVQTIVLPDTGTTGTIPTTGNVFSLLRTPVTGILQGISFFSASGYTQDNTNFATFDIMDLGASGVGTTAMLLAGGGVNTTRPVANGGLGTMVAFAALPLLPLAGGAPCTAGNVLRIRATVTGTLAAAITGVRIALTFIPS